MRKRWFISLIIGIIITGGCLGYLQFGRDMDVYGSHAMTADNYHEERLTVVVNKLYVERIFLKKRSMFIWKSFRIH